MIIRGYLELLLQKNLYEDGIDVEKRYGDKQRGNIVKKCRVKLHLVWGSKAHFCEGSLSPTTALRAPT